MHHPCYRIFCISFEAGFPQTLQDERIQRWYTHAKMNAHAGAPQGTLQEPLLDYQEGPLFTDLRQRARLLQRSAPTPPYNSSSTTNQMLKALDAYKRLTVTARNATLFFRASGRSLEARDISGRGSAW